MPSTVTSLDVPHTRLDPGVPAQYLQHVIIATLKRKGFEAAESGAIAEMERLLERHVQAVFSDATAWAVHANRSEPNAIDVLESHHGRWDPKRLWREAKKRRKSIQLHTVPEPIPAPKPETLDDLKGLMKDSMDIDMDKKPDITGKSPERRLEYAFDGAPPLPGKWTYTPRTAIPDRSEEDSRTNDQEVPGGANQGRREDVVSLKVTPASLEFVKSTVAEQGIDPELGIVHYRRANRGKRKLGAISGKA